MAPDSAATTVVLRVSERLIEENPFVKRKIPGFRDSWTLWDESDILMTLSGRAGKPSPDGRSHAVASSAVECRN
jgi:hypothetical protein